MCCEISKKLKGEKFSFSGKNLNAKKNNGGTLWDFPTPILTQNSKKIEEGTLWGKNFPEKSLTVPKKIERGDPLVSPGMVCYAEKQEKPFWFSSLGQMVQFGAIIFCRTFKNYFGQFVWIEKKSHYNSRVSLHEAPTKKYFTDKRILCKLQILKGLSTAVLTLPAENDSNF